MEEKKHSALLLDRCYGYLAIRPRSEHEIRIYLQKRKASEDSIEKCIVILKDSKLVNDVEFAVWWIEQRNFHKQKGQLILKQELYEKGIDKDIVNLVLENKPIEEVELALKALASKNKILKVLHGKQQREKAILFLQRRGFSYDISKKAFEEWIVIEYNSDTL